MAEPTGSNRNPNETMQALAGKYLTFKLAEEVYGIEILKVQEIIGMMKVTPVPRTPDFIRGVINLRGRIIPVVELRRNFGMERAVDNEKTCIIVVQIRNGAASVTMGLLVDEVSEVLDVAGQQIEPAPSFGAAVDTTFIKGIGKVGQKVVILLDIDRVLGSDELAAVTQVGR